MLLALLLYVGVSAGGLSRIVLCVSLYARPSRVVLYVLLYALTSRAVPYISLGVLPSRIVAYVSLSALRPLKPLSSELALVRVLAYACILVRRSTVIESILPLIRLEQTSLVMPIISLLIWLGICILNTSILFSKVHCILVASMLAYTRCPLSPALVGPRAVCDIKNYSVT